MCNLFWRCKVYTNILVVSLHSVNVLALLVLALFGRKDSGTLCLPLSSLSVFTSFPLILRLSAPACPDCSHCKATSPASLLPSSPLLRFSLSPLFSPLSLPFSWHYRPTAAFLASLSPFSLLSLSIIHPSIHTAVFPPFVIHPLSLHCRDSSHFRPLSPFSHCCPHLFFEDGGVTMVAVQAKSSTTCPV